jgi:hypothetical protein
MYAASNGQKFVSLNELDQALSAVPDHIIPIGILNTDFQLLNYQFENPEDTGVTFNEETGLFEPVSGNPPFFTMHTTVIALLDNAI